MTEELGHNALVIRVQPDEGITIRFGSKVPGTAMEVRDVTMDFRYGTAFTETSPEAYERLLLDVLLGEPVTIPRQRRSRTLLENPRPRTPPLDHTQPTRPLPRRHLGTTLRRPHDRHHRTHLETTMITTWPATRGRPA